MRCLSDELIESLAANREKSRSNHRVQSHLLHCEACRLRLQKAQEEAAMIHDLRELRRTRSEVNPLLEHRAE